MKITPEFNRLYHGAFLNDLHTQMCAARKMIISFEKFKEVLKYVNKDYPRYSETNDPVSTRDIRSKDLCSHIEFIIKWAGEYGFTPQIVEDDWNRLMELAHE